MKSALMLAAVLALCAPSALAQSNRQPSEVVARSGTWSLTRARSSFDDRVSCTVTTRQTRNVGFDDLGLMIIYAGRGGIQGAKYRVDDAPPSEMRLPGRAEQEAGFLRIPRPESDAILRGRRLRIQGLTILSGLADDDVSLVGARELVARIEECQRAGQRRR